MATDKKKILIVDDDDNLLTVLVDKLTASGYDADSAKDGEEGLEKSLKTHPDLILLDVMMPKANGWEMLERLRKDPWGIHARVLMLTSLEDMTYVARGTELGVHGYLTKANWSLDQILKEIEIALV